MWWIYLLAIIAYVICGTAYFYFFVYPYPSRFKKDKTSWTYVSFLWPITILVELVLIIIIDNLVYKFKKDSKITKSDKTPEEQAHYRKSAFKNDSIK